MNHYLLNAVLGWATAVAEKGNMFPQLLGMVLYDKFTMYIEHRFIVGKFSLDKRFEVQEGCEVYLRMDILQNKCS